MGKGEEGKRKNHVTLLLSLFAFYPFTHFPFYPFASSPFPSVFICVHLRFHFLFNRLSSVWNLRALIKVNARSALHKQRAHGGSHPARQMNEFAVSATRPDA